jgi:hypothetical protein
LHIASAASIAATRPLVSTIPNASCDILFSSFLTTGSSFTCAFSAFCTVPDVVLRAVLIVLLFEAAALCPASFCVVLSLLLLSGMIPPHCRSYGKSGISQAGALPLAYTS